MRIFKAWRYKCDFCGKNLRQKNAMVRHERGCTANPDRVCAFHKVVTGDESIVPHSVAQLLELLRAHAHDVDRGLQALRDAVHNCPTCILAALRQSGLCKGTLDEEGYSEPPIGREQFDYKKEHDEIWKEINNARAEDEWNAMHYR